MSGAVEVRERPILFSGEMVRAILGGRKTETRRVVKLDGFDACCPAPARRWIPHNGDEAAFGGPCYLKVAYCESCDGSGGRMRPRWEPGDLLYVRETHALVPPTAYAQSTDDGVTPIPQRRNAKAEGSKPGSWPEDCTPEDRVLGEQTGYTPPRSYRAGFATLWDSLNADRGYGWDENPWVWVVSFERTEASHAS